VLEDVVLDDVVLDLVEDDVVELLVVLDEVVDELELDSSSATPTTPYEVTVASVHDMVVSPVLSSLY